MNKVYIKTPKIVQDMLKKNVKKNPVGSDNRGNRGKICMKNSLQ